MFSSFFIYRLNDETTPHAGAANECLEGLQPPGFVIGSFNNSENSRFTIPLTAGKMTAENLLDLIRNGKADFTDSALYPFPAASTTATEHSHNVRNAKMALKAHPEGKIVIARTLFTHSETDIHCRLPELFEAINARYPEANVFCFHTPQSGTYIGATPEVLLSARNGRLQSMALAGTRRRGILEPWDEKNIQEQAIVTQYITDTLAAHGLTPMAGETFTRPNGPIEHLCTPVEAFLPPDFTLQSLNSLLTDFSPTPALCGMPKKFAYDFICSHENFSRGYYGGFWGFCTDEKNFHFMVNLRSARLRGHGIAYMAGGGITPLSDENEEWEETEAKIATLRAIIER